MSGFVQRWTEPEVHIGMEAKLVLQTGLRVLDLGDDTRW